jgi:NADPH:quinone reductase-like Zn-dependent oxidoreductase
MQTENVRRALTLVRFGNPDIAFEMRESPLPDPGPDEVQIEVEASGLNYADVVARSGAYQDCPPLPAVVGYEVVGRIRKLGANLREPAIGTRVVGFTRFGGYASRVNTGAIAVVPIPDAMPAGEAAALATQGATAWFMAMDTSRLHPGQHVLVQAAAGGVGLILVQLALEAGCIVYATASSPEKIEFLKKLGVQYPIRYTTEDFAEAVRRIQGQNSNTRGRGLDIIFDSLGGQSYSKARKLLSPGGKIFCFGAAEASSEKRSLMKMIRLASGFGLTSPISWLMNSQGLIGVNMLRIADHHPEVLKRCLHGVVEHYRKGRLKLHVGGVFPAEKIADAHRALGGRGTTGKLIMTWGSYP